MPNYQIRTSGHLWERKSCGTTLTLDFSTLGKKTTNKDTYLMSQLFMTIDVQGEARKAMMALTTNVASKKIYGVDLP
jgi:hypothetical protein